MIIMKFGGSSLANTEKIRQVGKIIEMHRSENPILVISAIGKTTDDLIEAGQAAFSVWLISEKQRISSNNF